MEPAVRCWNIRRWCAGWDRLGARLVLAAGLAPLAVFLLVLALWTLRHLQRRK